MHDTNALYAMNAAIGLAGLGAACIEYRVGGGNVVHTSPNERVGFGAYVLFLSIFYSSGTSIYQSFGPSLSQNHANAMRYSSYHTHSYDLTPPPLLRPQH